MSVEEGVLFFEESPAIIMKLLFLKTLGLGYLRLGQPLDTLSGGEIQRLKLTRFMVDVPSGKGLFLLDEPTTGLHPLDIKQLLHALKMLLEKGHTIICVEHDPFFISNSHWTVDLGPEGGPRGGRVIYQGWTEGVSSCANSYTGHALKEWQSNFNRKS